MASLHHRTPRTAMACLFAVVAVVGPTELASATSTPVPSPSTPAPDDPSAEPDPTEPGPPSPSPTATTPAEPDPSTEPPRQTPNPSEQPAPSQQPSPRESTPTSAPTPPSEPVPPESSTGPTAPPSGQPSPTPSPTPAAEDPELAYQRALVGAQTVAVAQAQRLLATVLAEQGEAERALAAAVAEATQARIADDAARRELRVAEEALLRTERKIEGLEQEADHARRTLGTVAREAYQGSPLSAMGVVLGAESPDELTVRYMGMRTLLRSGDRTLARNVVVEAQLRNSRARLTGQQERLRRKADQARAARERAEAAEAAARSAREAADDKSALVEAALEAAEQAKLEDYRRYLELLDESAAIGAQLATVDVGPGIGTGAFVRPGIGAVTSEYGSRLHPILGYVKIHTGIDFGRGDGSIYAADAGTVVEASWHKAYGNLVVVDHGTLADGRRLTTWYAHQAGLSVRPGQRVARGQVIGQIGSTGYSTGPHLHFEVRLDGEHTDPWSWVRDAPPPR